MTQKALKVGFPSINQSINQALTLPYTQCPSDPTPTQPRIPAPPLQKLPKDASRFPFVYPPSFLDLPRILGATTGAHLYKRAETVLSMGVKMGARERESKPTVLFVKFGQQMYTNKALQIRAPP